MNKPHVYYLPGLGTDQRVFQRLEVDAASITFLPFKKPKTKETIQSYAKRMAENIKQNENVILVGLSFGGILAQEIASTRNIDKVILVSAVKHPEELPYWMKMAKYIPLYQIPVPMKWRVNTVHIWGQLFGFKHTAVFHAFKDMMAQYDNHYYRWSTHQIVNWKGTDSTTKVFHIHGDNDRLFPKRRIKSCTVVRGGTHSMIYTDANKVSQLINSFIKEEQLISKPSPY